MASDINVGVQLPGEAVAVALFGYLRACRETMSQQNRDAWDALSIEAYRDWTAMWKGLAK